MASAFFAGRRRGAEDGLVAEEGWTGRLRVGELRGARRALPPVVGLRWRRERNGSLEAAVLPQMQGRAGGSRVTWPRMSITPPAPPQ